MPTPTRVSIVTVLAAVLSVGAAAEADLPAPGTAIPPVSRAETYFAAGAAFLTSLPEGSRVEIERANGAKLTLLLHDERLNLELPKTRIDDEAKTLTSPLGFVLSAARDHRGPVLQVDSPTGRWTRFGFAGKFPYAWESDGGRWEHKRRGFGFRLPDGTRVDAIDRGARWEVISLAGERLSLETELGQWSELESLPSPPLIPDLTMPYLAGDGDDWRYPVWEDHSVFAWNWYPYGLAPARAVEDAREGRRRFDLDLLFMNIDRMPEPVELAGYILGRRLSLIGGDVLTFRLPGKKPMTVYLLPGPADPDFSLPKYGRRLGGSQRTA